MNFVIAWIRNPANWNSILHNVIANAVVGGVAAIGFMIWTYLYGLPLPVVVIAGVAAPGAVLLTLHQLGQFLGNQHASSSDSAVLRQRIEAIEGELKDAKCKVAVVDPKERKRLEQQEYNEKREAKQIARLADTKAAIREQIDAAPRTYDLHEVQAWMAATDLLLARLHVGRLPENVNQHFKENDNKMRFQKNVAYLRSLLATLTTNEMTVF